MAAAVWFFSAAPGIASGTGERTAAVAGGEADDDDDYEGLPPGEGRDEVFGLCGACHSMKLVTQQGLSRSTWEEVLVLMVEEHEMAELEPEDEIPVLNYLTKFYGPDRLARRMAR
ncbi:MAG: hypothetical protein OXP07_13055 [Defluviicoccus sp.]|nr:hypothetical protein [Defluviicoccus sp.]